MDAAIGGSKPTVCLSDPPYGLGDSQSVKNNYSGYEDSSENLIKLVDAVFPLIAKAVKIVVLTPGVGNIRLWPAPTWTMAWFTPAGVGSGPWGFCCWQPILCYGKDPKLSRKKGRHPDAIVHTESSEKNGHPCPKPVKFWVWLMERVSEQGDTILDPFLGSGTGLIAAEMCGRTICAVELSPIYADLSVLRWQEFTGQSAVLEATGARFKPRKQGASSK